MLLRDRQYCLFLYIGAYAGYPYSSLHPTRDVYSLVTQTSSRYMYVRLMRPSVLLAFQACDSQWLEKVRLGSIQTPRSFSAALSVFHKRNPVVVDILYSARRLLCPRWSTLHLLGLNLNCHASAHDCRLSRSSCSLVTSDSSLICVKTFVSSANIWMHVHNMSGISLTKMTNSSGHNTLPCGILLRTAAMARQISSDRYLLMSAPEKVCYSVPQFSLYAVFAYLHQQSRTGHIV